MTTFFAFLHHLAAFTLVAALAIQFVLIREGATPANLRRLPIVDAVLGASAGLLLVVGLMRVFFFEKGHVFYFTSHAFLAKLALFVIVGLLSIVPTREYLRWRRAARAGETPRPDGARLSTVRRILHIELAAVALILLFAAMMARGV